MGGERILFFGTPQFAVPALEALVRAGRPPVLVVTQPSRPAGRGRRLLEPPVSVRARELGLPVEAIERVRSPEAIARFAELTPDLGIVVAFGQIFPPELLTLPRLGCINLHASLLPRWRGASPIAAAIAAGDRRTGVTVQRMAAGLDSGPVLATRAIPIESHETTPELTARLATLGAELLVAILPALFDGQLPGVEQDESAVTWAPKIVGRRPLPTADGAEVAARAVRAWGDEPGVVVTLAGEPVRLLAARPASVPPGPPAPLSSVVGTVEEALRISLPDGSLLDLLRVQRAGGRPVSGRDLANGLRLAAGMSVG